MAAVISDFPSDSLRFYQSRTMRTGSGQRRTSSGTQYQQSSRSRHEPPPSPRREPQSSPEQAIATPPTTDVDTEALHDSDDDEDGRASSTGSARVLSSRSSPGERLYNRQHFTSQQNFAQSTYGRSGSGKADSSDDPSKSISYAAIPRSARSLDDVQRYGGNTIKVRNLAHIQSFASEEFLSYRGQSGRRRTADDPALKYDISAMPITDIIEMVAGLLTKITTTNDKQHESLHRSIPSSGDSVNLTGLSSSVLAFHGKNVPSITILSYLSRIHKYCPTTYEVFLSLLVYFDRMTTRVNEAPIQALKGEPDAMDEDSRPSSSYSADGSDLADSPPSSKSVPESQADLRRAKYTHTSLREDEQQLRSTQIPLSHFFVVDSFNIHRLVIAGVTCASKFFSDVFYTNSRYAKVGGLPLAELNHLELQFLLLNDFRLSVPVEELEAYGTMLVEFYAREVISQRQNDPSASMAYKDDVPMTGPPSP